MQRERATLSFQTVTVFTDSTTHTDWEACTQCVYYLDLGFCIVFFFLSVQHTNVYPCASNKSLTDFVTWRTHTWHWMMHILLSGVVQHFFFFHKDVELSIISSLIFKCSLPVSHQTHYLAFTVPKCVQTAIHYKPCSFRQEVCCSLLKLQGQFTDLWVFSFSKCHNFLVKVPTRVVWCEIVVKRKQWWWWEPGIISSSIQNWTCDFWVFIYNTDNGGTVVNWGKNYFVAGLFCPVWTFAMIKKRHFSPKPP